MQKRHKVVTVISTVAKGCRSQSHLAAGILVPGVKCSRKMHFNAQWHSLHLNAGTLLPYYNYIVPRKVRSQSRRKITFSASLGDSGTLPALSLFCLCAKERCPYCLYSEEREKRKKSISSTFLSENTNTKAASASSLLHTVFRSVCVVRPGQGFFCDSNFLLSCVTQCLAQQTRLALINVINSTDLTKQSVWENKGLGNRVAILEF